MKKLGKKIRSGATQIKSTLTAIGAAASATATAGFEAGAPAITGAFKNRFGARKIRCNLCNKEFRANSAFYRFCRTCKQEDELFRFYNWLPVQA